jgi:hypothetical protein
VAATRKLAGGSEVEHHGVVQTIHMSATGLFGLQWTLTSDDGFFWVLGFATVVVAAAFCR